MHHDSKKGVGPLAKSFLNNLWLSRLDRWTRALMLLDTINIVVSKIAHVFLSKWFSRNTFSSTILSHICIRYFRSPSYSVPCNLFYLLRHNLSAQFSSDIVPLCPWAVSFRPVLGVCRREAAVAVAEEGEELGMDWRRKQSHRAVPISALPWFTMTKTERHWTNKKSSGGDKGTQRSLTQMTDRKCFW